MNRNKVMFKNNIYAGMWEHARWTILCTQLKIRKRWIGTLVAQEMEY